MDGGDLMEVVYSAFGRRHLQEAVISAASVKRKMPQVKISLTTDRLISSPAFDQVHVVDGCPDSEDPARFAKFHKASAIRNSASELVLYLDADTYVGADLASITSALDHADIALAHDTWRMTGVYRTLHPTMDLRDEPPWRTYLNTGVMLVRKSPAMMDFIEAWMGAFARDQRLQREQIVFQRLIYDSGLRLHVRAAASAPMSPACEFMARQQTMPVILLSRSVIDEAVD